MGFWGTLGKYALKAAPIAAAFIPGVGPLASMAIGGLSSAADTKLSGGSWKNALLSGGIGAGMGYAGGKVKGIGPSGKVAQGATQPTKLSGFARALDTAGKVANIAGAAAPAIAAIRSSGGGGGGGSIEAPSIAAPRVSSFQQRMANPVEAGRQEAMRNQPFRSGYQTTISDDGNIFTNQMPPIYPQYQAPPEAPAQQNFGDALTPRYARRRNPVQVGEE